MVLRLPYLLSFVYLFLSGYCHLTPDFKEEVESIQYSEFGKKILKEQLQNCRAQTSELDLMNHLNEVESDIIDKLEKEMNLFQMQQRNLIEQKQALKQKIFLTKYELQSVGDEINMVAREAVMAQEIYSERKDILKEQANILPQLMAIRNDEVNCREDRIDVFKPQMEQAKKLIKQAIALFDDLKSQAKNSIVIKNEDDNPKAGLSGQKQLEKKTGFLDAPTEYDKKISSLCENLVRFVQETTKSIPNNPYLVILESFIPLLEDRNLEQVPKIPEILNKLVLDLQNNLEIAIDFDKERIKNYNIEKSRLKEDYDRRASELNAIQPISENAASKEVQLKEQQELLKRVLQEQQDEFDIVQKNIEETEVSSSENYNSQMEKMEIIRKLKKIHFLQKEAYAEYLKKWVST